MQSQGNLKAFAIILSLLIGIRFLYLINIWDDPDVLLKAIPDAEEYHKLAISISEGKGFVKNSEFELIRTPFIPFLLSLGYLIKTTHLWGFIVNIFFSIIALYIIYRNFSIKFFLFFSAFFILSPNLNFHSLFPTADFIFGTFLLFFVIAFKKEKYLISILLLGIMMYIKPVAILLPPFVFLYFIFKKTLPRAFIFLILPFIIVLPWGYYIYKNTGYKGISAIVPYNFFTYYVPFFKAIKEHTSVSQAREKLKRKLYKRLGSKFTKAELYSKMGEIAFEEIRKEPLFFILTHSVFSINTLISPLSFRPFCTYFTKKIFLQPVQQEVFKLISKGKIKEGVKIFYEERIKKMPLWGKLLLLYAIVFNTFILFFIFYILIKKLRYHLIEFLIMFPLIFSTGVVGEARFRVMFEAVMFFLICFYITDFHHKRTSN